MGEIKDPGKITREKKTVLDCIKTNEKGFSFMYERN